MESKLRIIEQEISGCVKVDKSNWVRLYKLMSEVERDQLYKERDDTPSFTSWINALSQELGVHVSLLWSRKKAGKTYAEYAERAEKNGKKVKAIEALSVSPDSINLAEKIAGRNAVEMDRLIEKVVAGELSREDLRMAVKAKRATSGGEKNGGLPTSRHDRITAEERKGTDSKVTAADIAMGLRKDTWLTVAREDRNFLHVYHAFPEFRVDTGTSHFSRRIDVLIAETVTALERDKVVLRAIEIKIDRNDLLGDHKMAEYTEFCDYFYLGLPADNEKLVEDAKKVVRPEWGILTVDKNGKIVIVKEPVLIENAAFRDKTLSTCIVKLIKEKG